MKTFVIIGNNVIQDTFIKAGLYTFNATIKSHQSTHRIGFKGASGWVDIELPTSPNKFTKAHAIFELKEDVSQISLCRNGASTTNPIIMQTPMWTEGNNISTPSPNPADLDETTNNVDIKLSTQILQTNEKIQLIATEEQFNEIGQGGVTAFGMIKVMAGDIELKVGKDGVISSINQSAEEIQINADRIRFTGSAEFENAVKNLSPEAIRVELGIPFYEFKKEDGVTIPEELIVPVNAFRGSERVNIPSSSIAKVSSPNGILVIDVVGGYNVISIIAQPSLIANGTVVLRVPVLGKNYDVDFNFKIVDKPKDGKDGVDGTDGKGIEKATVTYQNHTNGTSAPTGAWSSTVPAPVKGRYLWTRTVTKFTEGADVTTYSVSYYATDGQNGADGKGISSTTIHYQQHTNGSTVPTGTWSTTIPTPVKGRYLWTRTTITYTTGSPTVYYSTSYYATDGKDGKDGVDGKGISIKGSVDNYNQLLGLTGLSAGDAYFNKSDGKLYIWDGFNFPPNGQGIEFKGEPGKDGLDGISISSLIQQYINHTSKTVQPAQNANWLDVMPKYEDGLYMWSRFKMTLSNGQVQYSSYSLLEDFEAMMDSARIKNLIIYGDFSGVMKEIKSSNPVNYYPLGWRVSGLSHDSNGVPSDQNNIAPKIIKINTGLPKGMLAGLRITPKTNLQGIYQNLSSNLVLNEVHTAYVFARKRNTSSTVQIRLKHGSIAVTEDLTTTWARYVLKFTPTSQRPFEILFNKTGAWTANDEVEISKIQLAQTELIFDYRPFSYVENAFAGSTSIEGGVVATNMVILNNEGGEIKSYVSGIDANPSAFAAGVSGFGTDTEKKNIDLRHNGSGHLASGNISWDEDGNAVMSGMYTQAIEGTAKTILRTDGSGQLASGNISWDEDGNVVMNGIEATNAIFSGLVKVPFKDGNYAYSPQPKELRNYIFSNNNDLTVWYLPEDNALNGARIMFINWRTKTKTLRLSTNRFFGQWYSGDTKRYDIPANSFCEMVGFSLGTTFQGWLITNSGTFI